MLEVGVQNTVRYHRILGDDYRHVWVVGDLHGCYQQLLQQLVALRFDERCDLLISVGDLIDRGKDSPACLALLNAPWFISVVGNHEAMAQAVLGGAIDKDWRYNGGEWYFQLGHIHRQSIDRLIQLTMQLPHIIEVTLKSRCYVIAHADYPRDFYRFGEQFNVEEVLWSRQRILRAQAGISTRIGGADRFIFGHTPLKKVAVFANQIYIDTGVVFGGTLTLLRLC